MEAEQENTQALQHLGQVAAAAEQESADAMLLSTFFGAVLYGTNGIGKRTKQDDCQGPGHGKHAGLVATIGFRNWRVNNARHKEIAWN